MECRIAIIGGGPAGSFCAYNLAKNGLRPLIFDNSHPREKPCGGGISPFAQAKFPFIKNLPISIGGGNKLRIISPLDKETNIEGKQRCITVSRLEFDESLIKMATEAGAKLVKEKVIDVKNTKKGWIIITKKTKVFSEILVGADGVTSLVRKKTIGSFEKADLGFTYGYFVKGIENKIATIKFLKGKKGYIWAFPRVDHTSLGIGIPLSEAKGAKRELDLFISKYYPKIDIISEWVALIPSITRLKTYEISVAGDNWILIGDAAGHVDPIFAEGILYALWSAELAAKAIVQINPRKFDKLWRREYGTKLIEGVKFKNLLYNKLLL
ncbi:hypothetical protein DRO69_13640, partial [Candidatus Bathyarchaeota archaeon]